MVLQNTSSKKSLSKNSSKPTIVIGKIHAKWCPHCVHLVPEWKKMKMDIKKQLGHKYNIVFTDIEQSVEKINVDKINNRFLTHSNEKLAVQNGYPTIFKIDGGKLEYFAGKRTALELTNWYSNGLSHQISHHNHINTPSHSNNHKSRTRKSRNLYENNDKNSYYNSFINMIGGKTKKYRKSKK
jgi:thiol-disulfide isomerase/thioredoxin